MNRHERRKTAATRQKPDRLRKLVERAEREGYVLYQASPEHTKKLVEIQHRILAGLDDISCLDGFIVLLGMTASCAALGCFNDIDQLKVLSRDVFLKNCAERYDSYAEWHARHTAKVNMAGGDA